MVLLQRLWLQITADKRRFGLLCAVCGVGLLLWARIIIISNLPRTAVADDKQASSASDTAGGEGSSDKNAPQHRQFRTVEVSLWSTTERDPFKIDSRYFPKPSLFNTDGAEEDKSARETVENDDLNEAGRVARLRAVVKTFSLDAVMLGQPMAIINGKMYRVGTKIPAPNDPSLVFELVELGDRLVVLEHEGHRFEVKMPTPGAQMN